MGTLTRNSYQFDASISIEDSDTYHNIVSDINGKLKTKIDNAVQSLNSAKNGIEFDPSSQSTIESKISDLNNISSECNAIGSKIDTGVQIYEEYDSSLKKILDDYLIDGLFNGMEIHFNDDGTVHEMDLDNLFAYFDGLQDGYYYGCNQNPYEHIKETNPEYYEYLKKMMKDKYNLTDEEIEIFMNKVDNSATCTYARSVNEIIYLYKDRPDLFEETFGYPLYIEDSNGNLMLNTAELLTDYVVTSCSNCERDTLIKIKDGKYVINPNGFAFGDLQAWDDLDDFLAIKTKDSKVKIDYNIEEICNEESNMTASEMKKMIEEKLRNGESVSIGLCPKGQAAFSTGGADTIPFYSTESGVTYPMGGGHWITITEVTDEGIIVDSWGERCLIKFEDLLNDACFNMFSATAESGD